MGFGLKSMTLGKGNRLAAILFTCQNQMGKGREWNCLFILDWEMAFELNFWWEILCSKMGMAPSLNEKYEKCRSVGVGVINAIYNISKVLIITLD